MALIPTLVHLLESQFPQALKRMGSLCSVCRQQDEEGIQHCLSKNVGPHKLLCLNA